MTNRSRSAARLILVLGLVTGWTSSSSLADVTCRELSHAPSLAPAPYEVVCDCSPRDRTNLMVPGPKMYCNGQRGFAGGEVVSDVDGYVTFKGDSVKVYDWMGPESKTAPKAQPFEPIEIAKTPVPVPPPCAQIGKVQLIRYTVKECNNRTISLCAYPQSCTVDRRNIWQVCKANDGDVCPDFDTCAATNKAGKKPSVSAPDSLSPAGVYILPETIPTPPPATPPPPTEVVYRGESQRLFHVVPSDYLPGCQAKPADICFTKTRLQKHLGDDFVSLGDGGPAGCLGASIEGKTGCPSVVLCAPPGEISVGPPTDASVPGGETKQNPAGAGSARTMP